MSWIARDKNGELFIYASKPQRDKDEFLLIDKNSDCFEIDNNDLYPEVTWENSPKELIVKEE